MALIKPGFIYLIECRRQHAGKIGFSSNPEHRAAQVQNGNPYKVKLYAWVGATWEAERVLHEHLRPYKIRGEWFRNLSFLRNIFLDLEDEYSDKCLAPGAVEFPELTADDIRVSMAYVRRMWINERINSEKRWTTIDDYTNADVHDANAMLPESS